jgi:hypothetical protein
MASQALDHAAKQMGFRDYATYQAYQQQQAMMRQAPNRVGVGTTGQIPAQPQAAPAANAPPENWLQRLLWGLGGGHQ